jgi:hypothetical protein
VIREKIIILIISLSIVSCRKTEPEIKSYFDYQDKNHLITKAYITETDDKDLYGNYRYISFLTESLDINKDASIIAGAGRSKHSIAYTGNGNALEVWIAPDTSSIVGEYTIFDDDKIWEYAFLTSLNLSCETDSCQEALDYIPYCGFGCNLGDKFTQGVMAISQQNNIYSIWISYTVETGDTLELFFEGELLPL